MKKKRAVGKPVSKGFAFLCTIALTLGMAPGAAFAEEAEEPGAPVVSEEGVAPDADGSGLGVELNAGNQSAMGSLAMVGEPLASGVTVTLAGGGTKSAESLAQALAWANDPSKTNGDIAKITLAAGTYSATNANDFRVEKAGLIIEGAGSGSTTINCGSFAPSGQAGFLVQADNVTLRGMRIEGTAANAALKITTIGDGFTLPLINGGTLEDLTLKCTNGHGIMIHGANNVTLNNITVESATKCAIGVAYSQNVGIRNTKMMTAGWSTDVGFQYGTDGVGGAGFAYGGASSVVFGPGNVFSNGMITSSRPASAPGGMDVVTGLEGWTKTVSDNSASWYMVPSAPDAVEAKDDIEEQIEGLSADSTVEQVNAVVENLTNSDQDVRDSMTTKEDAESVADLEALYLSKNPDIASTELSVSQDIPVNPATSVTGAALSVEGEGYAKLVIDDAEEPSGLPAGVGALLSLDISLQLYNASGGLVADDAQPKAPITITLVIDDADGVYADTSKVVLYHQHGNAEPTQITPISVTHDGKALTVVFTLSKLSTVVVGLTDYTPPTPGDNPVTPIATGGNGSELAKTGDAMTGVVVPLAAMMAVAGVALCAFALFRRARQK